LRNGALSLASIYFWNAGSRVTRVFTPSEVESKE
jgi:hypothetical protein